MQSCVTAITVITITQLEDMRFYDRQKEFKELLNIKNRSLNEAQMTVLVGRRRIGKTELVLKCDYGEPTLYFFVARKSETLLCRDFISEAEEKLGTPIGGYSSFPLLFRHLLALSKERPFTLIIDEFQDWIRINPAVFSEMQREWDLSKHESRMNLIISGSIYSLIHRIFEDSKEPLFARANKIINLKAFDTSTLKEILTDYNPAFQAEDLLTLYTITHGIAWYVSLLIDAGCTSSEKMVEMLTEENSPFINEGKNILIEEFGADYGNYFSILSCLSEGEETRAKIENITGIKEIGGYLDRLRTHYKLIEKHTPIGSNSSSKNVRYVIQDNFLTLWFRFFYKYQSYVASGALSQLSRIIKRDISGLEGKMLERYFIQKFQESGKYTQVGQYWDRKGENEIDLVAVNEIDGKIDVFEIKKDKSRYDESLLKSKVDQMLTVCPQFSKMELKLGVLSLEDML